MKYLKMLGYILILATLLLPFLPLRSQELTIHSNSRNPQVLAPIAHGNADAFIDVAAHVQETFMSNGRAYLKLDNQICFLVEKILVSKASGWFDSDKYGSPCIRWFPGDRVEIQRTDRLDFPFLIINLETREEAFGVTVNFERERSDKIIQTLEEILKEQKRLGQMQDKLIENLKITKEIQKDLRYIKQQYKEGH